MKPAVILLIAVIFNINYPLHAQTVSFLCQSSASFQYKASVLQAPDNGSEKQAYRHGMALSVLGPVKIAVGCACIGLLGVGLTGKYSSLVVVMSGVYGGFHLLSGIGLTVGGAHLLKKAKHQRAEGTGKASISLPAINIRYPMSKGEAGGLGLLTTVRF